MELQYIFLFVAVVLAIAVLAVRVRRRDPGPTGGISRGLSPSPRMLGEALSALFSREHLDEDVFTELEETLIAADAGVEAARRITGKVRRAGVTTPEEARNVLRRELRSLFTNGDRSLRLLGRPAVVLVVGVNGTGKTTSVAKLAARLQGQGYSVLLGAADTYRAAAGSQLKTWAERTGVEMVGGEAGRDPASVAFDAYAAARARDRDVVLIDTAGRLHSKSELMQQLGKIKKVLVERAGELSDVLLVIDATGGQNSLSQARVFLDTVGVTGIVLTKLDGTAKGGIVIAIEEELGVPVQFVGIGESLDDLVVFDPGEFVDALVGGGAE